MLYLIALFLHVTGALLLAAAMGIEWLCIIGLRKAATIENAKGSLSTYSKLGMIGGIGTILILIPGIYMAAVAWRDAGWVAVGLLGIILIGAIGGIMTGRKMRKMKGDATGLNQMTSDFRKSVADDSLVLSIRLRTTILAGIVYMMTVKTTLTGSIIVMVISIFLGFLPIGPRASREVSPRAVTK